MKSLTSLNFGLFYSQRIGGNHEELDLTELYNLECEMEQALVEIRNRKVSFILFQICYLFGFSID